MHAAAVIAVVIAALAALAVWITSAMNTIDPKEPRT